MAVSKSPDVSGVKVWIDKVVAGVPAGAEKVIGHITSFGNLIDKSRNETKLTPINDTQFDEIISLGSLTQNAFTMGVLYDAEGVEGVNLLEESIDNKTEVQIIIELNNAINPSTGKGTTYKQIIKCSSFVVSGEQDGKYTATFNGSKLGLAVVTPAS